MRARRSIIHLMDVLLLRILAGRLPRASIQLRAHARPLPVFLVLTDDANHHLGGRRTALER
jgi:hypothetical protein